MSSTGSDEEPLDQARVRLEWPGVGESRSNLTWPRVATTGAAPPVQSTDDEPVQATQAIDVDTSTGASMRRAVVDAYDRLAERLLERMNDVHQDLGADVAELRSEVIGLRQAIRDLNDRVGTMRLAPLAPLVKEIALLREEMSRDQVGEELAALREEVSRLRRRTALRASPSSY